MYAAGNFVGREYYHSMVEGGYSPDFLMEVGSINQRSIDYEVERTGNKWHPPIIPPTCERFVCDKLSDPDLLAFIKDNEIDLIVQGGVGILKQEILTAPKIGIINVHPGALPAYRGNSCPEWQLIHGKPIVATAHLIDEGIDTGPVVSAAEMTLLPHWTYEDIRANIYAHCARVLLEALAIFNDWDGLELGLVAAKQPDIGAVYRQPVPSEKLAALKTALANGYGDLLQKRLDLNE